jgi:small conductance mechanosensitive channel
MKGRAMGDQLQALDQVRSAAFDLGMKFGPKLLVASLILVAGYVVARWAGNAMGRMLRRFELEPPARALLERAVKLLVLGLFVIMALQNLGVELLPLIAGLGVAGAGVALAMQGVLGNIVAGLTIIFTRPYRVGDYISVAKEEGEVLDINLSSTILGHADLSRVVVPNRKIVGEILHNYGGIRQLAIEVGITHNTDVDAALKAIRELLAANGHVLAEPVPAVAVARIVESGVVIGINPWVKIPDIAVAGGEINEAILETFRERGIALPRPQREIRMLPAVN